jgi:hypothetical protein
MSVSAAKRLVVAYFIVYALVLLWPGVMPFNRIRPMLFGLPFIMVWVAAWVGFGFVVLLLLERAVSRAEQRQG